MALSRNLEASKSKIHPRARTRTTRPAIARAKTALAGTRSDVGDRSVSEKLGE